MSADLALYSLQGVVDGLGVALDSLGDNLIGVPVEVEGEDAALEVREDSRSTRETGDEALSSSAAITWSSGSKTVGPAKISSRVVYESPAAAGGWLKETY